MSTPSLTQETVTALVHDATAAPSLHNAQPEGSAAFSAAEPSGCARTPDAPQHTDPPGRALHLGRGAAMVNLRVAAVHRRWHAQTRLLPDPRAAELWL
ncbi:hypothetical protein [Streptomyces sp. NPDC059176]|uniref:hypothetical protein n=1 Tax=unclassified Streptomyces TaxID=2593676 RepID=UPI0036B610A3